MEVGLAGRVRLVPGANVLEPVQLVVKDDRRRLDQIALDRPALDDRRLFGPGDRRQERGEEQRCQSSVARAA
jgi:hypothetical protein